MFLPQSGLELDFVPFVVDVFTDSPVNSSSIKESLKYLRRSFCCVSYINTSDNIFIIILKQNTAKSK